MVGIEAHVLRGDKGVLHGLGDFLDGDVDAVFRPEQAGNDLSLPVQDPRGLRVGPQLFRVKRGVHVRHHQHRERACARTRKRQEHEKEDAGPPKKPLHPRALLSNRILG